MSGVELLFFSLRGLEINAWEDQRVDFFENLKKNCSISKKLKIWKYLLVKLRGLFRN
jgi:hypothetical protein